MMRALPVSGSMFVPVLYKIAPYCRSHGEISDAVAAAANQDPLFPSREDGCLLTAALLLAVAATRSQFNTNLVGDGGRAFGLYQIRPPVTDALGRPVTTNLLTNPRDASLVAVDLIRTSMIRNAGKPWGECLADLQPEEGRQIGLFRSLEQTTIAERIAREARPLLLPASTRPLLAAEHGGPT